MISSFFTVIFYHPGISLTDIYTLNLVFSCGDIRLRMIIMMHLLIEFLCLKMFDLFCVLGYYMQSRVMICEEEKCVVESQVTGGDGRLLADSLP